MAEHTSLIPCLLGQISASLAAMSRTIQDFEAVAKREMIKAKQEKAQMYVVHWPLQKNPKSQTILVRRVQKFRSDYIELRSLFEKLKTEAFEQVCSTWLSLSLTLVTLPASSISESWTHNCFWHTHLPIWYPTSFPDHSTSLNAPSWPPSNACTCIRTGLRIAFPLSISLCQSRSWISCSRRAQLHPKHRKPIRRIPCSRKGSVG